MKKITFLTSFVALTFAVPAMAVPSNTSSTFPSNGVMEEDYTYQNQATVTNLKVSSGTATTTANYANCPTAFPNSDEGAESTDECYTACTVSDFPANSHIASVTGKNYSGANVTDTCAIASCDTGYTYNSGAPSFPTGVADSRRYVSNDGSAHSSDATGLSAGEWDATWNGFGTLKGTSVCNNIGADQYSTRDSFDNATTGNNCWCKPTSWTPVGGTEQTLTSSWVSHSSSNDCNTTCSWRACSEGLEHSGSQVEAFFGAVTPSAPSCDANEIAITWADASAEDIAANDAGSVTYGGDIRTPKKAVHKPGKIFTGWTFNTPSGN